MKSWKAVLAHELGHFKCKHVIKMLIGHSILSLISLAILGWLINEQWFYTGLRRSYRTKIACRRLTIIHSWFHQTFTFYAAVVPNFQRKFEFEADDFAASNAKASKMISGLVKL